ncbi:lipoyl synthase [Lebetimonas natsushimae]|uniref:Lipoyl synthase n=1 Tax=Lebetimonas natsushimae TaxID=1936991 RepID=A0A292YDG1_9BACT|nr:lipoyl synthase [Lebetimonas natsushimae]GAX87449.1 lipoyl synthase [Lebetimonas natsushimae]
MKPKVLAPSKEVISVTKNIIDKYGINTVCYSSKCPNISECFARGTATFMILGNVCTRNCRFCGVNKGKPLKIDEKEPIKIANAVKDMKLKYVVITSVDRDDLKDFGSNHWRRVIEKVNEINPDTKIEALTPDFQGDINALNLLVSSPAYKLAHNIETVKKLHKRLKPKSSYELSLKVLEYYSKFKITKSSLIVGFGESFKDIEKTLIDLKSAGVSQITIGQYLQPSPRHYPVKKYYSKEEFKELENLALSLGFSAVVSGELVRSSYYADKL